MWHQDRHRERTRAARGGTEAAVENAAAANAGVCESERAKERASFYSGFLIFFQSGFKRATTAELRSVPNCASRVSPFAFARHVNPRLFSCFFRRGPREILTLSATKRRSDRARGKCLRERGKEAGKTSTTLKETSTRMNTKLVCDQNLNNLTSLTFSSTFSKKKAGTHSFTLSFLLSPEITAAPHRKRKDKRKK